MATSNKRNWETHEKIALKGREASGNQETLHKAIYVHLHTRKLLLPSQDIFLLEFDSHCY